MNASTALRLTLPVLMAMAVPCAAQWTPPAPYDQISVIENCERTRGDIAVATKDGGRPVIYLCQATADRINRAHPGAGHFYYVHEFGHHILHTSDEWKVDEWAAKQLTALPDGEYYLRAAIDHFRSRRGEPRVLGYPSVLERAAICERALPADSIELHEVSLSIWEPIPCQASAMSATLYVDGERVGRIHNLDGADTIDLGSLTAGAHTFALKEITGYHVGCDGLIGAEFLANGSSSGSFHVRGDEDLNLSVRVQRDRTIRSAIQ